MTDPGWLQALAAIGASEVNFWQPRPAALRQLPGTPWIFKMRGGDRIGGYGFLSYYTVMPSGVAWETFGPANGVASYAAMATRLRALRHDDRDEDSVGCVVLSDVQFVPDDVTIPGPADWKPNTVRGEYYDLTEGEGRRVWDAVRAVGAPQASVSPFLEVPGGVGVPMLYLPRIGQGAFRLMVMDAYERRCAVTGEKTLPALDAAHIRPFRDEPSHRVNNGLLLRSDIHRLFDQGYVTVDPDLRFRVSSEIRDRFHNGVIYYDLDGRPVRTPAHAEQQPDREALDWHASTVFRG